MDASGRKDRAYGVLVGDGDHVVVAVRVVPVQLAFEQKVLAVDFVLLGHLVEAKFEDSFLEADS
jgi:hypothetical protein